MRPRYLLVFLLLILPLWLVSGCNGGRNVIEGSVHDENLNVVAGAEVKVIETGQVVQTGPDGRFAFQVGARGAVTIRVDGAKAVGGPFSTFFSQVSEEDWKLAPGGKFREDTIKSGDYMRSVAAFVTKIDTIGAIPVSRSKGGVVVSMGFPDARLEIPPGAIQEPDAETVGVSLTLVPKQAAFAFGSMKGRLVLLVAIFPKELRMPELRSEGVNVRLVVPNSGGLSPNTHVIAAKLDESNGNFVEIKGAVVRVSEDGKYIVAENIEDGGYTGVFLR